MYRIIVLLITKNVYAVFLQKKVLNKREACV